LATVARQIGLGRARSSGILAAEAE